MKVVVCDVDGVILDFWNLYCEKFNIETGYDRGDTKEEKEFWDNPPWEFWANLKPICDPDWVNHAFHGFRVVFLTNCAHPAARRDNLLDIGVFKSNTTLWCNPPGESKKDILEILNPIMFIDDFSKHIEEARALGIKHCIKYENRENACEQWNKISNILREERK